MIASQANRWLRVLVPGLLISVSMSAQQPTQAAASTVAAESEKQEISDLKAQLAEQQRQLETLRVAMQKQQEAIEKATKAVESAEYRIVNPAPRLGEVASTTPILPVAAVTIPNPATVLAGQGDQQPGKGGDVQSPLSFPIGAARFTPLGFVDFIGVTRSTNTGNILATGFSGIPYSNALAGQNTENRLSMQNSRLGLRIDSNYKGFKVLGYLETDFLGNAATGIFQTSNSDTLRLRLFWVDVRKDQFELMAGQSWSMLTPNRVGISPLPSDIFYTQNVDTNYQVGLPWARQTGFRLGWHPNDHVSWGFAVEDADQYTTNSTVLPSKLSATYLNTQLDSSGGSSGTPTFTPDFISKIAFDGHAGGHAAHFEIAGLLSTFRTYDSLTFTHTTVVGGGGSVNGSIDVGHHLTLISANHFGAGNGRYFQGNAPDVILNANGNLSLVRSGGTVDGFEFQANPKVMVYGYYGADYILKETALDSDGKTIIGYGAPGNNAANKSIQEATFGFVNNFWKNPQYGALSLNLQYSYVTRSPWNLIDPTVPANAHLNMGYVDLRYTLP